MTRGEKKIVHAHTHTHKHTMRMWLHPPCSLINKIYFYFYIPCIKLQKHKTVAFEIMQLQSYINTESRVLCKY